MEQQNTEKAKQNNALTKALGMKIALQFAFIIAIPLLIFSIIGKWISNHYQNRLFLIAALVLALTTSTIWLYLQIIKLYDQLTKK